MSGRALAAAALLAAGLPAAFAAGNHHAVDDAAILEPGQCEFEAWVTRPSGGGRALHPGLGCRIGPVELGAAAEYARQNGASETSWELQLKWAREVAPGLAAGFSFTPGWQARARPRLQGTTVSGLMTWNPVEPLAVHLNIGRDFVRGGPNQDRYGAAIEWTPRAGFTLLAERFAEDGTHFLRGGLRWAASDALSFDLSRAHRLGGPGASNWTLGTTVLFSRP